MSIPGLPFGVTREPAVTRLLPDLPPGVRDPVHSVLGHGLAQGCVEPPWIAVEDEQGEWVRVAASCSLGERARAVVAASTEVALVQAARLGLGGALWLPPSTMAMKSALEAAAAASIDAAAMDPRVVELVTSGPGPLWAVTWRNRPFWKNQLGVVRLLALLAELAGDLEAPPALLPWPALLVSGRNRAEIVEACDLGLGRSPVKPLQPPEVVAVPASGEPGVATLRALLDLESTGAVAGPDCPPQPVYALPSGRRIGFWAPSPPEPPGEGLWCPGPEVGEHSAWLARSSEGHTLRVPEVVSSSQVDADVGGAVRLPGWLSLGARPASPAGLLIERLLASCNRKGLTLWVPNVDSDLLRYLLRLDGELWVDGPAVPSAGGG